MENKIIDAARSVFIERGYAETSMSEIATRAGINRPALHYYFRTKDKMFQAVFGSIVSSVVPKVFEALAHKEMSIAQRVGSIIDAYYALFLENPRLPMFMLREFNRDSDLLINTLRELNVFDTACRAFASVQEEMNEGKLNKVSMQFVFYNFYSLLAIPFLTKDVATKIFQRDDSAFCAMLSEWKQNIIMQMKNLLEVK
ncbi:MAG: TetR/AcrR family transcriptional regulator [Bacteroidaceae bacterium]|nr:TetR/AcrR family transcriptional regulator [Bacteroidaceae bacterium]